VGEPRWRRSEFKASRAGDVALVTIDNGEDYTKPTFFGRTRSSRWSGCCRSSRTELRALVITGKPFVFAPRGHHRVPGATRELRSRGQPRRPRALRRASARCRTRPWRRSTAPASAAASSSRCTATRGRSRRGAHFACPECFLGIVPALGRHAARAALVGAETAVKFIVANPMRQNRMLTARGVRARLRRPLLEPASSSTSRSPSPRARDATGQSRDSHSAAEVIRKARAQARRTRCTARRPRPTGARPDRRRAVGWSLEEGYAPRRGRRRLLPGRPGAGLALRLRPVDRRAKQTPGCRRPSRPIERSGSSAPA
jgi:hypothetical protein